MRVLSLYCRNGNQNLRERAAANFPVCTSKVSYAHAQKWSVPKRVAIFEILILNNHAQLCAAVACKLFFNAIKETKKPNALDEAALGFVVHGSIGSSFFFCDDPFAVFTTLARQDAHLLQTGDVVHHGTVGNSGLGSYFFSYCFGCDKGVLGNDFQNNFLTLCKFLIKKSGEGETLPLYGM